MIASGFSTVATCLPLFATRTLILQRFAAVLSVTMALGLAYVLLFLTPMIAMFGPVNTRTKPPPAATLTKRTIAAVLRSRAVRFILVCMLGLAVMVRLRPLPAPDEWSARQPAGCDCTQPHAHPPPLCAQRRCLVHTPVPSSVALTHQLPHMPCRRHRQLRPAMCTDSQHGRWRRVRACMQMIAPTTNKFVSKRGPLGNLGSLLLVVMSSALAVVLLRVAYKVGLEHREARALMERLTRRSMLVRWPAPTPNMPATPPTAVPSHLHYIHTV